MKYECMIRSRPSAEESVVEKHERLSAALRQMMGDWSLRENIPPVRERRGFSKHDVALSKCLPKGVTGRVSYQNRLHLLDEGRFDDYLALEFDPEKIDYGALVEREFEKLVNGVSGYRGHLGDVESYSSDFGQVRLLDLRFKVYRLQPVNFFDDVLVERAFGCSVGLLKKALHGAAESVRRLSTGLLVVMTSSPTSLQESELLNARGWTALQSALL